MNRELWDALGQDQHTVSGGVRRYHYNMFCKMKWDHEQNYIFKQNCGILTVN